MVSRRLEAVAEYLVQLLICEPYRTEWLMDSSDRAGNYFIAR